MSNPEIKRAEDIKRELYLGAEKAKNIDEKINEVVPQDDVDKLLKFREDNEVALHLLKQNFQTPEFQKKFDEVLKGNQVLLLKEATKQAKSQEDKAEMAVYLNEKHIFSKYDVALKDIWDSIVQLKEQLKNPKDRKDKKALKLQIEELENLGKQLVNEYADLKASIGTEITQLNREIMVDVESYNVAQHNNYEISWSETKTDKQRLHKTAKEVRKLFEKMSENAEQKLKLQSAEKKIMRQFAGIVSDVLNHSEKSVTSSGVPVEKFILDLAHSKNIAFYTPEDLIKTFEDNGLVIKKENWRQRRWWERGITYLKDISNFYRASHDVKDADAYNSGANLRKYFDLIRQTGSFQSALDTFNPEMEKALDLRKLPKNERFAKLKESKNVTKDDIDKVMDLCLDFNLDGMIAYGDTGIKWGNQIKEMFSKFVTLEEKKHAFENILNAVSKANKSQLQEKKLTVDDVIQDFETFTAVQNFLKNPPMDMNYILKYGENAFDEYKKAMTTELPLTLEERNARDKAVEEGVQEITTKLPDNITKIEAKAAKAKAEGRDKDAENYQKAAEKLKKLRDMDAKLLREGLREVLEGQAAAIRQSGLGAGVDIPLTRILKGLSFNFGARYSEDGSINAGVNLAWNGSVDLSANGRFKGFAGVSAGTNLLSIPILGGSAGLGYTFENSKQDKSLDVRSEKTFTLGVGGLIAPSVIGWNLNIGVDRDLDAGRLQMQEKIKSSVGSLVVDLMSSSDEKKSEEKFTWEKFKFDEKIFKEKLEARYPKTKKETLEAAVKNLGQILQYYDWVEMNEANVALIAEEISSAYSQAWSNMQALKLADKGWYISGAGLSVSFFQGVIPVVGILKFAKHNFNGTSDTKESTQNFVAMRETWKWNRELVDQNLSNNLIALEQQLGVEKGTLLLVADQDGAAVEEWKDADYIQISLDKLLVKSNIALNPAIKQNIKIDKEKRTIVVHKNTLLRASSGYLSDSKAMTLDIGAHRTDKSAQIITKDSVNDFLNNQVNEWNLNPEAKIAPEKLPKLAASLDEQKFSRAFKELKAQVAKAGYEFPSEYANLAIESTEDGKGWFLYDTEKNYRIPWDTWKPLIIPEGKHLVIDMTTGRSQLKFEEIKRGTENFKVKIEGLPKAAPISADVLNVNQDIQNLIDGLYTNLSLLKSNAVRNVAHKSTGRAELTNGYTAWRKALSDFCCELPKEWDYGKINLAADKMIALLVSMDKYIQHSDGANKAGIFKDILEGAWGLSELKDKKDYASKVKLQQLLLALDGMFSRTANVRGTNENNKYQLQYGAESNKNTFNQITTDISTKIIAKMKRLNAKKTGQFDCYEDYANLFKSMNEGTQNIESQVSSVVKEGVIAYNYGNPADMMRPIINPHIIEWTENKNKLPIPETVKLHVLQQLFQEDSILVVNILQSLKERTWSTQTLEEMRETVYAQLWSLLKWEAIDIWLKKVTMSAAFSTGYFAQCVNHMVMIGDLHFNVEGSPDHPDGAKNKFEAEIAGSAQVVASMESDIQNNNTTRRVAVAAEIARFHTDKPGTPTTKGGDDEGTQPWDEWDSPNKPGWTKDTGDEGKGGVTVKGGKDISNANPAGAPNVPNTPNTPPPSTTEENPLGV